MRYMILMFGDQVTMMQTRTPEWISEMIEFMHTVGKDLESAARD